MSDTTAVARIDDTDSFESKTAMRRLYSSIKGTDIATRLEILKAVNEADPIADHLGEVIELRHIVVQAVDTVDEKTGEPQSYERVILVSDDGKAFVGSSKGLMNSVRTILGVLGEPETWGMSIPVTVTEEGPRGRQFFRVNIA